jgi:hypothetical protein
VLTEQLTQDSEVSLNGQTSGTAINITVTARNSAGESRPTAPVTATVP